MSPETTGNLKYAFGGILFGAVLAMIIGFTYGGWTTAASSKRISDGAILSNQAEICVAQFVAQSDYLEQLVIFKKGLSWDRVKFVAAGGWDKMPGQDKADNGVDRACASKIEHLGPATKSLASVQYIERER